MPVPDGPQTTRFSCRSIHSNVVSDRWVGAGIDDTVSSQVSNVLPVGNPAAVRRMLIDDALPAGEFLGEQRPDGFGWVPALRFGGGQHVGCVAAHVRQMQLSQQVDDLIDRCGRVGHDAASPKPPSSGGGLHRVVLVGASSLPDRVRSEDRGDVAVGEPFERGGVTERPIDAFDTVQPGELDRVGHLHLHPRRPCGGGLDQPHPGAVTEREELGLGRVRRLGLAGQRAGRAWRVVGVVDARVPRRRPQVPGDLDRARGRDVGGDDLVAVDTDPHDSDRRGCAGPSR